MRVPAAEGELLLYSMCISFSHAEHGTSATSGPPLEGTQGGPLAPHHAVFANELPMLQLRDSTTGSAYSAAFPDQAR